MAFAPRVPCPAATEWYYVKEQATVHIGPITSDELKEAFLNGNLTLGCLAWEETMDEWLRVANMPELRRWLEDRSGSAGRGTRGNVHPQTTYQQQNVHSNYDEVDSLKSKSPDKQVHVAWQYHVLDGGCWVPTCGSHNQSMHFCDSKGNYVADLNQIQCADDFEWLDQWSPNQCLNPRDEGWIYATDWEDSVFQTGYFKGAYVRKRQWMREAVPQTESFGDPPRPNFPTASGRTASQGRSQFGVPMENCEQTQGVPSVVFLLIKHIRNQLAGVDGLFSSMNDWPVDLGNAFNYAHACVDVNLDAFDIYACSGGLLWFFHSLPESLLTKKHFSAFIQAAPHADRLGDPACHAVLVALIASLPPMHKKTWEYLADFLADVAKSAKEDAEALATAFAPCILRPLREEMDQSTDSQAQAVIHALILYTMGQKVKQVPQENKKRLNKSIIVRPDANTLTRQNILKDEENKKKKEKKGWLTYLATFLKSRPKKETLAKKGIIRTGELFGVELNEVALKDGVDGVPVLVRNLIEELQKYVQVKGLFRVSGQQATIQSLKMKFDFPEGPNPTANNVTLAEYEPHVLSGLLKLYFRELPIPLLTFELYQDFVRASEQKNWENLDSIVSRLPAAYLSTWRMFVGFCAQVVMEEEHNLMSTKNVAIVIAPNILRKEVETFTSLSFETPLCCQAIEWLIRHQLPEDYKENIRSGAIVTLPAGPGAVLPERLSSVAFVEAAAPVPAPSAVPAPIAPPARPTARPAPPVTRNASHSVVSPRPERKSTVAGEFQIPLGRAVSQSNIYSTTGGIDVPDFGAAPSMDRAATVSVFGASAHAFALAAAVAAAAASQPAPPVPPRTTNRKPNGQTSQTPPVGPRPPPRPTSPVLEATPSPNFGSQTASFALAPPRPPPRPTPGYNSMPAPVAAGLQGVPPPRHHVAGVPPHPGPPPRGGPPPRR